MVATEAIVSRSEPAAHTARCLYCQSDHLAPHWRGIRDRLGHALGQWGFDRCCDCGSLRLSPMPAEGDLAAFYPPVYSFSRDLGRHSATRRWLNWLEYHLFFSPQYRAQARQVLRGIGWDGHRGLRLLDIGCGCGLRLAEFQQRGFDVHGLDLQPEVIEYLRNELNIAGTVGGIDALDESFEPESFDLITAFYLLEHVPSVAAVLERCRRLLKPGGWFVGVVPVCDGLQARLFGRRWLHVTEAPRHLSLPSHAGLLESAQLAGYEQAHLRSDALFNCAGIVGGSLFPGSDLTRTYGGGRWLALVKRLLGGGSAVASLPLCWAENSLLGRTSHGMLFGRRG